MAVMTLFAKGTTLRRGEKIPATTKKAEPKAEVKEETVDSTVVVNDPVAVMENTAQDTAEASDAKNVQSQTPEERSETKPADEVLLDKRDGIESDSGQRGDK